MAKREVVIRDTHRGLLFRDGVLVEVLGAGRHRLVPMWRTQRLGAPQEDVMVIDVRERELTIKNQEILTADKVAIRVSIITNFQVVDPKAAVTTVADYEDRIYSDVQLAARRSLASMALEDILTNRNQLSDDILRDVSEVASAYGVSVRRAHVKDLVFPGNLQEIMNRVLATERLSEAERVDARTKAETSRIAAEAKAAVAVEEARSRAESVRLAASAEADSLRIREAAEQEALRQRAELAQTYAEHPELLRLRELEALEGLGRNANARLYIGVDRVLDRGNGD